MKCPACGHEMGKKSKCLRCGYAIKDIVPIDPEKIEKEKEPEPERREIHPDDVHVSRAGGSIFGDIFGGGIFGGIGSIFGNLFGGFDIFGDEESTGYEYDPKYYDDFGNERYVPDEFERESVEISDIEYMEPPAKEEQQASSHAHEKPHDKASAHQAGEHTHKSGAHKHAGEERHRPKHRR